ncbi:MAG: hypothetical protein ACLQBQ_02035 [Smithella sp.]
MKAGDTISRKTLKDIADLSAKIHYTPLKETWLMKDLIQTFKDKRYSNIPYGPKLFRY